jgi:hypothetical protein
MLGACQYHQPQYRLETMKLSLQTAAWPHASLARMLSLRYLSLHPSSSLDAPRAVDVSALLQTLVAGPCESGVVGPRGAAGGESRCGAFCAVLAHRPPEPGGAGARNCADIPFSGQHAGAKLDEKMARLLPCILPFLLPRRGLCCSIFCWANWDQITFIIPI